MALKTVQATVNGVITTLTLNTGTGKYEATITAPSKSSYNQPGHYYNVQVKATDEAGNITTKDATDATIGTSLRLTVKEKVAPTQNITYPTTGAYITNNKPAITWSVTDNDSGVNPDTIGITIDSGAKITAGITKTAITGGYQCAYTPTTALSDGSHTIKVDASDFDGNASVQKAVTVKIDTVPPTLNVSSPAAGLVTNNKSVTLTGTTNDTTSSPVAVTIKLNTGTAEAVIVEANGSFSKALTLVEGVNTILVTATDSAGKSSSVTRTVTIDIKPPVITAVTSSPNPSDVSQTITLTVTVSD